MLSQSATEALFARYVTLLGVAPTDWAVLERAASQPGVGEVELMQAVNALCGTTLTDRGTLSVLRYELGLLAG